jgi:hypothetical protein
MVPLTTPPLGPNLLGWTDAGAAAFDGVPLTSQQKMSSLLVVDGYVRSHVRMSLTLGLVDPESPPPDPYVTVLPLLLDPKRFPALVAAAPAIVDDNEGEDSSATRCGSAWTSSSTGSRPSPTLLHLPSSRSSGSGPR